MLGFTSTDHQTDVQWLAWRVCVCVNKEKEAELQKWITMWLKETESDKRDKWNKGSLEQYQENINPLACAIILQWNMGYRLRKTYIKTVRIERAVRWTVKCPIWLKKDKLKIEKENKLLKNVQ